MLNRISKFLPLALALLMAVVSIQAQSDIPFSYAAVVDGQLWVYPVGETPIQIETPDARLINNLTWSPDGSLLAYIVFDENYESKLLVTHVADGSTQEIATSLNTGFPVSFQDDDYIIYTLLNPTTDPATGIYVIDIWSSPISTRDAARLLGTFSQGAGCGGGSNIPADWVYYEETQGLGGFHLILEATPYGILHSAECGGSVVALLDPETGEDTIISQNFTRTALSPDRTKIAGVELNVRMDSSDNIVRETRLLVADLTTLEITELTVSSEPDQITFSADSSAIFYSTRIQSGDFYDMLSDVDQAALNANIGFDYQTVPRYTSEIWQVNISDNSEIQVYTGDAYAIGRMIALTDGSSLIFSAVPNLDAWVAGLIDGTIQFNGDFESQKAVVQPVVYSLNLSDNSTTVIGAGLGQITIAD
ncbi:MAG: hypothetical protein H7X77_02340 [Anaerolineae bacterium]|nr:hypothetical protein [Anaerolineae bacterium]